MLSGYQEAKKDLVPIIHKALDYGSMGMTYDDATDRKKHSENLHMLAQVCFDELWQKIKPTHRRSK